MTGNTQEFGLQPPPEEPPDPVKEIEQFCQQHPGSFDPQVVALAKEAVESGCLVSEIEEELKPLIVEPPTENDSP